MTAEAWVARSDWIDVGIGVMKQLEVEPERSYLLQVPTPDMEGVYNRPIKPGEASSQGRALLRELRVPVLGRTVDDEPYWLESDTPLFEVNPEAVLFWREHSERHVLPTW